MRFHDLRHTDASLLIEQGENKKHIQNQLGHSSPTMTLDVYPHLMKPVNQQAALRLEKTVFENFGSKMVAQIN
ncbi:MAG: tyrosine-type recombinase/integrase [Desulfobacterales bacterium]|nr:tyrosine-type recombinase/integrase [Desulfobacterales bacterium]